MVMPQQEPPAEFTGGLYWRKSRWNARACVPVILRVSGGRLCMKDHGGVVFDAPCAGVLAELSLLGTLTLQAGSGKYHLVGSGGEGSPAFPPEMQQELYQALRQGPGTPGAAAVRRKYQAGEAFMAGFDDVGLNGTEPWVAVLRASGARVA